MGANLVILGPPGAGKGTQADWFARDHGIPRISTGDILRDVAKSGTELGRRVKERIDRGHFATDEDILRIVRERLERPDTAAGMVLDGFPRRVVQAEWLDGMLEGRGPIIIVDLVVPEDDIVRRLGVRLVCDACGANGDASQAACGRCGGCLAQRADDGAEIVLERLRVYERESRPLLDFYRGRATFRSIDGAQAPGRVAADLAAAVRAATLAAGTLGVGS